jgi:hypothetical protein
MSFREKSYNNTKKTEETTVERTARVRDENQAILIRMARSFGGLETGIEPTTFQSILNHSYNLSLNKK